MPEVHEGQDGHVVLRVRRVLLRGLLRPSARAGTLGERREPQLLCGGRHEREELCQGVVVVRFRSDGAGHLSSSNE